MRTEDGRIIQECLNGDPSAFGLLVDKYKSGIYAFIYDKLRDFQDAQDVTQEVFEKAYRSLHSLRNWESFTFWLYQIAYNLCKNWIRDQSKRPDQEFIEDQKPSLLKERSLSSYRESQEYGFLHEALDSLPDSYREVLLLHYFGKMAIKDMARSLGASPTAIGMRLSRARARLKEDIIAMMSTTFDNQRLQASFTFRIVEAVKGVRIHPISSSTSVPWGVSMATGILLALFSLGSHLSWPNFFETPINSASIRTSYIAEASELPVDAIGNSKFSGYQGYAGGENPGLSFQQNAVLMTQQGEGGKIPEEPSIQFGKGTLNGIAYSPDGKIFAVGTSFGVKLYDADNLGEIETLQEENANTIAFSPDGKTLAIRNADQIALWDFQARKKVGSIERGNSIAFSPDSKILAVSYAVWNSNNGKYQDNVIKLWDIQRQELLGILKGHTDYIYTITFTPDGKILASSGSDKTIRLWDVKEQRQTGLLGELKESVFTLAISSDEMTLVSGSGNENEGEILLWNTQEQKQIGSLKGHQSWVEALIFSPDGKTLVSGSYDQTIRIWNIQEQKELAILQGDMEIFNTQMAFNPNGKTFATTSDSQKVRFWDIQEQRQVNVLDGFMPWVYGVAISPDIKTMATDNNAMILFWDIKEQRLIGDPILPEKDGYWFCNSIAFSPDGKMVAAGAYDGLIYLIDAKEQKKIGILKGHTDWVRSLAFSPDGKLLASGSLDMVLRIWDVEQRKQIFEQACPSHTHMVAFSPDGKYLACGIGGESAIRIWDVKTKKQENPLMNAAGAVISIAISPDGKTLASGSASTSSITFWDFPKRKQIQTVSVGNGEYIRHLMFSPDSKWLASQANDGACRIWDVETGDQLANLKGHKDAINNMTFSQDGKWLATASSDGTVLFWELDIPVQSKSVNPMEKATGTWGEVKKTALFQNFPNPFNPETWIPYSLGEDTDVKISIHNTAGNLIRTLNLGHKPSGMYASKDKAAYWDGRNENGESVASDVYFYVMEAGKEYTETKKMVIVR